jgi:hypothetical protein
LLKSEIKLNQTMFQYNCMQILRRVTDLGVEAVGGSCGLTITRGSQMTLLILVLDKTNRVICLLPQSHE